MGIEGLTKSIRDIIIDPQQEQYSKKNEKAVNLEKLPGNSG